MAWEIIFDPEFREWFDSQSLGLKNAIAAVIRMLEEKGPALSRPYADTIHHSTISHLKELRIQYKGDPWRVLFAFDPIRRAIILVGGNKTGDPKWYDKNVSLALQRYECHLKTLESENVHHVSGIYEPTTKRTSQRNRKNSR